MTIEQRTTVLVIGAGPAGSAAALMLARRGVDVLLVDRAAFPREKVCGDALIPDALAALRGVGLLDRVLPLARPIDDIRLYAPGGREVRLRGECAIVPRLLFDDVLRASAMEAGARFMAPCRAIAPIVEGSVCAGARVRLGAGGPDVNLRARWTILATGAAAETLRAFDMCERTEASATAVRMYLRVPDGMDVEWPYLSMAFQRGMVPGYGWMFPAPDSTYNVGVIAFHDTRRPPATRNLRTLMSAFLERFIPARSAARAALERTRLVGAPLRTALRGARLAKPGLLVAGEAAGTTYSLTGEGIGKALETGMQAGEIVADALDRGTDPTDAAIAYMERIEAAYRDRYAAYARAQRLAEFAALGDLLGWRAHAGRFVRDHLEGIFRERIHPGVLFSRRGVIMALFR